MAKERAKIVVGEKSIAEFKKTDKTPEEAIIAVSAEHGFVRRDSSPVMLDRSSRYVVPFGCNTRVGMKKLIAVSGLRLNLFKQEVVEEGLLALIEKHGLDDLKAEFEELTKR